MCKICNRNSCASWMHSAEEVEEWDSVEGITERQLKIEVIDLRREVATLKKFAKDCQDEIERMKNNE